MRQALNRGAAQPISAMRFGLDPERPTLLVSGGSQGAWAINQAVSARAEPAFAGGVARVLLQVRAESEHLALQLLLAPDCRVLTDVLQTKQVV